MAVEKKMIDYLKKVSPGNPIRTVIDDLVRSDLGAMIVFETPELYSEKLFEGGFKINCKFSPQRLFELAKMDGGIIVSNDLKRIVYANVLITPDNSILTTETGTRHKAAERCAKQANTFVITVSERRRKTSLYLENSKYFLKSSDQLLRDITANLQVLEEQRNSFNKLLSKLDILELSDMVAAIDVSRIIQKAEIMSRISEDIKSQIIELGIEGKIINMRFRELTINYEKIESEILRDYSKYSLKKSKVLLSSYSFEDLLDLESISKLLMEKELEEIIQPRGFRFLLRVDKLTDKEISLIVSKFRSLSKILDSQINEFEELLGNRADTIKQEIETEREQILSGKEF
jgi:diadenylate cyclase